MNNVLTYELIRNYYLKGYYSNNHIKELCRVNVITQAQYATLTGEVYWESTN